MPLGPSAPALSSALRAALLSSDAGWLDNAALTSTCDAIANTVLSHIVANALVNVPALGIVAPPGVAGGPCTGAAVGTVA
jgi:LytS/YehU family sensor histidine kinase